MTEMVPHFASPSLSGSGTPNMLSAVVNMAHTAKINAVQNRSDPTWFGTAHAHKIQARHNVWTNLQDYAVLHN